MLRDKLAVLGVHVQHALAQLLGEHDRVHAGQEQVGRIEVEAERRMAVDQRQREPGGLEVVGELARVALEREAHAALGELVEHRQHRVAKAAPHPL